MYAYSSRKCQEYNQKLITFDTQKHYNLLTSLKPGPYNIHKFNARQNTECLVRYIYIWRAIFTHTHTQHIYIYIYVKEALHIMRYHLINPLQTKRIPLYLKTQSLPRCKHFSSRL